MQRRFPAEWEKQDGVLLAWPHKKTDWEPILSEVIPVYIQIISHIAQYEKVLLVGPDKVEIEAELKKGGVDPNHIAVYAIDNNDTWARDFGPLTVMHTNRPLLLDFGFNGWGLKFPSNLDNQISGTLKKSRAFKAEFEIAGLILEGGSVESDGQGTLLTTTECLLNQNRNPHLSKKDIEDHLGKLLGARHFLWLDHGYLAGDDTDSHIDTLARLAPDDQILYIACDDQNDEHYQALKKMEKQLQSFKTRQGRQYRLTPLPFPRAIYDEHGQRLPATYANFLIINEAVLVPTYHDKNDSEALKLMARAFPDRKIIGIDCVPLIKQHGSLHCVTMQLPQGVLA